MFCNKCGNQIPDDSTFCGKCGANLSALASQAENIEQSDKNQVQFAQPSKKKKGKKTAIIVSIAAVAVIGTIAAIMLPSLTSKKVTDLEITIFDVTGTYSGTVNEDNLPDGKGVFNSVDSRIDVEIEYTGGFLDGEFSGQGTLIINDFFRSAVYSGEFKNNYIIQGELSESTRDGVQRTYVGEFADGKNIWYMGQYEGKGKETYVYDGGQAISEGIFKNGNLYNGKVTLIQLDGDKINYEVIDGKRD